MPRISREESLARRDQIVDACERLYQYQRYHDITLGQIAEGVSFGRANIYNYFQCKDEIFLALLQREYERWILDLHALADAAPLSDEQLTDGLATSLAARPQLLKLMTMNLYDMEENSRVEKLVEFKEVYARAVDALRDLLVASKNDWDETRIERFVFGFLPFMYGIYPYVFATDKQSEAMAEVGIGLPGLSIHDMSEPVIMALLANS